MTAPRVKGFSAQFAENAEDIGNLEPEMVVIEARRCSLPADEETALPLQSAQCHEAKNFPVIQLNNQEC
jgi:hypothetical protein